MKKCFIWKLLNARINETDKNLPEGLGRLADVRQPLDTCRILMWQSHKEWEAGDGKGILIQVSFIAAILPFLEAAVVKVSSFRNTAPFSSSKEQNISLLSLAMAVATLPTVLSTDAFCLDLRILAGMMAVCLMAAKGFIISHQDDILFLRIRCLSSDCHR